MFGATDWHWKTIGVAPGMLLERRDDLRDIHAVEETTRPRSASANSGTLAHLLGDGLVYTYWSGRSDSKADYREGVKSSDSSTAGSSGRMNVFRYDGRAVVTGRAQTSRWS